MDTRGPIEKVWTRVLEKLSIPAHAWNKVISEISALHSGQVVPEVCTLLKEDCLEHNGERYNYARATAMSDEEYVRFLLDQAYTDTAEYKFEMACFPVLPGREEGMQRQQVH